MGTETIIQTVVVSTAPARHPARPQARPIKMLPLIATEFPVVSSSGHRLICKAEVPSRTHPGGDMGVHTWGQVVGGAPDGREEHAPGVGGFTEKPPGSREDTEPGWGPDLSSTDPVTFTDGPGSATCQEPLQVTSCVSPWVSQGPALTGGQIRGPPPKMPNVVR